MAEKRPAFKENIHRLFDEAQADRPGAGHRVADRVTRDARADPRGAGRQDPAEPGAAATLLRRGVAHRAGRFDPRARRPAADPGSADRRAVRADRGRAPMARIAHGASGRRSRPSWSSSTRDGARGQHHREPPARGRLAARGSRDVPQDDRRFGYSVRQLAQKIGKDKGYVENRLRLAECAGRHSRARVIAQRHDQPCVRADEDRRRAAATSAGEEDRRRRAVAGQAADHDRRRNRRQDEPVTGEKRRRRATDRRRRGRRPAQAADDALMVRGRSWPRASTSWSTSCAGPR